MTIGEKDKLECDWTSWVGKNIRQQQKWNEEKRALRSEKEINENLSRECCKSVCLCIHDKHLFGAKFAERMLCSSELHEIFLPKIFDLIPTFLFSRFLRAASNYTRTRNGRLLAMLCRRDGVSNDTEKSYLDNSISLLALPLESHTKRQSNEHRINSRKWILYYENSCSFSHHSSIFLCCLSHCFDCLQWIESCWRQHRLVVASISNSSYFSSFIYTHIRPPIVLSCFVVLRLFCAALICGHVIVTVCL